MKIKLFYAIICHFVFITTTFCQSICFKANVGVDQLIAFPSSLNIEGKEYHAIDRFASNLCGSFSLYLTANKKTYIGLTYSSFPVKLNKHNFPTTFDLSGQANVTKIGLSFLFGKFIKSNLHTYFILEPSHYYTENNTSIVDTTGMACSSGCEYLGSLIFGIGLGVGFDYYFNKYIGLSSSTRFDFGMAFNATSFFLSYPSIQLGILLSN